MAAPYCQHPGCRNQTWNPDGLCHLHVHADQFDLSNLQVPDTPEGVMSISPDSGYSTSIYEQVKAVFPDIDNQVHPASVRRQVVIALRSAVSVEAYRRFPQTDVQDEQERQAALKQQHHEVVAMSHVTPTDMDDDVAASLSYSSEDAYGRAFQDSVGIASWGAQKEWELARSMGIEADEHGVPYGESYEQYLDQVAGSLDTQVSDEYMRQLARYPRIIEEVSGRKPLCDRPVIPGMDVHFPDLPKSEPIHIERVEDAESSPGDSSEGDQDSSTRQNIREGVSVVGSAMGTGASKLLRIIGDSVDRRREREAERTVAYAQAKEERRERKAREEEARIRKLQLQELEYNRRQRRRIF